MLSTGAFPFIYQLGDHSLVTAFSVQKSEAERAEACACSARSLVNIRWFRNHCKLEHCASLFYTVQRSEAERAEARARSARSLVNIDPEERTRRATLGLGLAVS